MDHKKLIEAALFVSQKPLDLHDLAKITGLSSLGFLKESLEALQKEYEDRGIEIVETGERWHMQVHPHLLPAVSKLTPHQDLPEGPKRALALILYKEPFKQSDLIKMQGNKAYAYIKRLKKLRLIKAEKQGHTSILSVSKEIERYFGQPKNKIKEQLTLQPAEKYQGTAPELENPQEK